MCDLEDQMRRAAHDDGCVCAGLAHDDGCRYPLSLTASARDALLAERFGLLERDAGAGQEAPTAAVVEQWPRLTPERRAYIERACTTQISPLRAVQHIGQLLDEIDALRAERDHWRDVAQHPEVARAARSFHDCETNLRVMETMLDETRSALAAERERSAALLEAASAMADAGQRLLSYVVRSHGSGAPGTPDWGDTLEAGLDASRDWRAALDAWRRVAGVRAGEGGAS